ncbi:chromophore lyase CpcT/CpeT [Solitalea lacus]|uniref:chromophore lyase CpcT/CpeT n=1 Tax=Solitalea lacus TaxID=2911172 RepID=UPI001EDB2E57|nr:chromophore lyase CpcT/CpeT [Solitalea lacus]UKJ08389.1 chromophore lyase CpcT/CpeT [Solitalea lacus]
MKAHSMRKFILLVLLCLSASGLFAQKLSKELKQLRENLSGKFTNEDQTRFNPAYKPESFIMKQVWPERTDGLWFYGEQAVVDSVKNPYKQFVWHVTQTDQNRFLVEVFALNNPKQVIVEWKGKPPLLANNIDESKLTKETCVMYIVRKTMIEFTGGTREKTCIATLNGAAYKTIEFYSSESTLMWWERGFNAGEQLVFGPEKGGIIYRKTEQFNY